MSPQTTTDDTVLLILRRRSRKLFHVMIDVKCDWFGMGRKAKMMVLTVPRLASSQPHCTHCYSPHVMGSRVRQVCFRHGRSPAACGTKAFTGLWRWGYRRRDHRQYLIWEDMTARMSQGSFRTWIGVSFPKRHPSAGCPLLTTPFDSF